MSDHQKVTQFSFESRNPAEDKDRCFQGLRQFATARGWPAGIANEIELIVEEWWSNVLKYSLDHQPQPQLHLVLNVSHSLVQIEIRDNGVPFDPTSHQDPDITLPAEQRPIGGLGIFMMKKLSRGLRYERAGNWNRLVIEKDTVTPVLGRRQGSAAQNR